MRPRAPEHHEEGGGERERERHHEARRLRLELQDVLQEEERVEGARVPDHRLAGDGAEEREHHHAEVPPAQEVGDGRGGCLPLLLHAPEHRRLAQSQPDVERDAEEDGRQQERDPPAPVVERGSEREPAADHGEEGQDEPERGGGLDPFIALALACRDEPGAKTHRSEASEAAHQRPARDADRGVRRMSPTSVVDTHHRDRGDEGVLAPEQVAEPAEEDGADGPDREAGEKARRAKTSWRARRGPRRTAGR
jgi:hypothetical protein